MTRFTGTDCHVHIFGPRERHPQRPDRAYTPGVASIDALTSNAEPLGITHFVIVQPSVYGTDNSCLLDTLDALDGAARGVVVVDPKTTRTATLDDWSKRGARGLRINLYGDDKGAALRERFQALADIAPAGWHIEVIAPMPILEEDADLLAGSRVPVVIDHYGLPGAVSVRLKPDTTGAFFNLLRQRHVWMKLSAPYRAIEGPGSDPHTTMPPVEWLRAYLQAAPERLIWGSDWPHTPPHEASRHGEAPDPFRPIDYGRLFGDFLMAVSEPRALEAILAANPARLYGFA